ncbi:hypothetical protein [Halorarum salinum]|uniref:Uncharacterized protein n=1 Tax=Halorarum salinum TaxID=2743089 RepID=A0A7D5QFI0_9EURY|nr:hypothetical protein [Halobaculum salinum]QLG63481.1 hypothetical protein HUG12_17810 [Halobaculum salinum]
MTDRNTPSNRLRLLGATVLVAAVGGATFLAWRRAAPLSRLFVPDRRDGPRGRTEPNPRRNPGTDPA